jgi:succinate dehydrogenase / fumarate reductase cytochrome b subunit
MSRLRVFSSSVGTKILIGITGILLFIYLIIHIVGNLMIFRGQAFFNKYAYFLEGNALLPIIEIALLLLFLLHIYKTVTMYLGNQQARPVRYEKKVNAGYTSRKSFASTTMIFGGLWLILFLIIHVKAFRFSPEYEWPAGGRDLYRQELENFTSPLALAFYVISMLVVGSHLWHGVSSSVQSLGFDHPRWTPRILLFGKIMAVLIATGFIIVAIWVHLKANGAL